MAETTHYVLGEPWSPDPSAPHEYTGTSQEVSYWRGHTLGVETAKLAFAKDVLAQLAIDQATTISRKNGELAENNETIDRLQRDPLTGLWTRATLEPFYKQLQRGPKRRVEDAALPYTHAVLMLDGDNFKRINDKYGHDTGDQALRDIADLVTRNVRARDHAIRYGGEEFVIMLPHTSIEDMLAVAERIRSNATDTSQSAVTLSIGAALLDLDEDLAYNLRRADRALYAAKEAGRIYIYLGAERSIDHIHVLFA
jgi:diguanylate cyclase (GGDEF)-like protein